MTCRRDGCHEPATDDVRRLCPYHRWGQPRRPLDVERKAKEGLPSRTALPGARPWADRAACRDRPELDWFPESQSAQELAMAEMAKEVCRCCPVAQECLDYALDSGEKFGIWGGSSSRERSRLRRQRRQEAA